jgi:ABC-type xylose transport system permease subunit
VRVRTRGRVARVAHVAALPPAAFAVHQLRYLLAFGGQAGVELQRTGHSYLNSLVPWIVLLLALVVGGFLRELGRVFAGHTSVPRYTVSLAGMWLACTGCLVAIFCCQEFLEGLFAAGHPAGLAGIFGYGGWWAIPAAACVGLVLAAWLHGARWVLREVARRRARVQAAWVGPALLVSHPGDVVVAAWAPLVAGWSDRGPPG